MEKIQEILEYIKNSGLQVTLMLNPFWWGFDYQHHGTELLGPTNHMFSIQLLFLKLTFIIDSGNNTEY